MLLSAARRESDALDACGRDRVGYHGNHLGMTWTENERRGVFRGHLCEQFSIEINYEAHPARVGFVFCAVNWR